MLKPRGCDLGRPFTGQTGPNNAISDVPGLHRFNGNGGMTGTHWLVQRSATCAWPQGLGRLERGTTHWVQLHRRGVPARVKLGWRA